MPKSTRYSSMSKVAAADGRPIRSPSERNLLQFSPFAGLEEGNLSPTGRFCRVMTKTSGSNSPLQFRAIRSHDLSQAGSADSQDDDCGKDNNVHEEEETTEERIQNKRISPDDFQSSFSPSQEKRTWAVADAKRLLIDQGRSNNSVQTLKELRVGAGFERYKVERRLFQKEDDTSMKNAMNRVRDDLMPHAEKRPTDRNVVDCQAKSGTSEQRNELVKQEVWDDSPLGKEAVYLAFAEDDTTAAKEKGKTKIVQRSVSPTKGETNRREHGRLSPAEDLQGRLSPREDPRIKALHSIPGGEQCQDNDLIRHRSSRIRRSRRARPLRLTRSLDEGLESKPNKISTESKGVSGDNGKLRLKTFDQLNKPSKEENPSGVATEEKGLPLRKNSFRDLLHRRSGTGRLGGNTQLDGGQTSQSLKGDPGSRLALFSILDPGSFFKTRKERVSPRPQFSSSTIDRNYTAEEPDVKQSSQWESGPTYFQAEPKSNQSEANRSLEVPISNEDFAKRSVEIERYLNNFTDA